jgi:uncharacterized protein
MQASAVMMNQSQSGRAIDDQAGESERTYALFIHLVGLLSMMEWVTSFASLIGVGVMWLIRRHDSPFLDDHGKEALNFQISLIVWFVIGIVLTPIGVGILILLIGLPVLRLVGCIRGALAASRGEFYRYPMCFRFIG